jgi:hypothetical protein
MIDRFGTGVLDMANPYMVPLHENFSSVIPMVHQAS